MLTQAARRRSTNSWAIWRASSAEPAVVKTMRALDCSIGNLRLAVYQVQSASDNQGMSTQIKFGTSGWRAIIADEFTVANVRRALAGIARYVDGKNPGRARVIVGRDPRFMGERLVEIAAEVLAGFGVQALVIAEPAPAPAIAYEAIRQKVDGAINFTASHNPAEYNGIKFSTPDGAPALPEVTQAIEKLIDGTGESGGARPSAVKPQAVDPKPAYMARLREIIDLALI